MFSGKASVKLKRTILVSILFVMMSVMFLFGGVAVYFAKADTNYSPEYYSSYFYTAFGSALEVKILKNNDSHQDFSSASNYKSAVKIGEGSFAYNCFTYALIYYGKVQYVNSMNKTDKFNIEDSFSYSGVNSFVRNNPCLSHIDYSEVQKGDIVTYEEIEGYHMCYMHAAIVEQKGANIDDCIVDSKWGHYAIYRHKIKDCPYKGSSYVTRIKNPDPAAKSVIEFKFYRVNHTYSKIYPVYKNGPVVHTLADEFEDEQEDDIDVLSSHSVFHKIECSGCGAFYYDRHHYIVKGNNFICENCGLVADAEVM